PCRQRMKGKRPRQTKHVECFTSDTPLSSVSVPPVFPFDKTIVTIYVRPRNAHLSDGNRFLQGGDDRFRLPHEFLGGRSNHLCLRENRQRGTGAIRPELIGSVVASLLSARCCSSDEAPSLMKSSTILRALSTSVDGTRIFTPSGTAYGTILTKNSSFRMACMPLRSTSPSQNKSVDLRKGE